MIALAACLVLLLIPALRYFIDPACPGCSARAWRGETGALSCGRCGWVAGARMEDQLEMTIATAEPATAAGTASATEKLLRV